MKKNLLSIARFEDVEQLFDELSDSIIIIHPQDHHIIYFNKAVYQSLGYTKEEFLDIGDSFFKTYNDDDSVKKTHEKVVSGERISFVSKHVRKNGSIQYADLTLSPIVIQNSTYICGIWKDITEVVINHRDLNTKNNRLKRFLEILTSLNNSHEFLTSDVRGYASLVTPLISNGLDIDRVSVRLYNENKDVLESISIYDRNVPEKIKGKRLIKKEYLDFFNYMESHARIAISDISQSKTLKDMIKVFFSEDGMINSLLSTSIKVNSKTVGFIFLQSKNSVTWDKEYELFASQIADQIGMILITKELKHQQSILEKKVQERTKTLHIAKNIAENATLSKTRFLSNMSHELRTPLNAIIGFLSLIDKEQIDLKNRFFIDQIQEGSDNLLKIINDVLDLSKIEAGKMETQLEWIDLKEFYDRKFNFYKQLFEKNNLEFNYNCTCRPGYYYTDSKLLKMIVNNLLSNALKFTNTGSVEFILNEISSSDTESQIVIQVIDTGIGIKESDFSKLFRTFEQIEQVNSKEYQGTGLGLAITKQVVEQLQGTVSFNSVYEKGTSFTARIPMKYQSDGYDQSYAVIEEELLEINDITNKSILVVDDDRLNQFLVNEIFENTGAVLDIAINGLVALKKAEVNSYDLILMDIEMPIMDGHKATQLIKLNPALRNTPIFAVTANALNNDSNIQMSSHFDQYIIKPYTKKTLLEKSFLELTKKEMIETKEIFIKPYLLYLEEFTGISIKDGLNYVSNNEQLLQTVILEIIRNHDKDFQKLIDLNNENDTKGVYRVLHTLKSLVKTIGMNEMYKEITELESKLLSQDETQNYLEDIRIVKEKYENEIYIMKYIDRMVNRNGEDTYGV